MIEKLIEILEAQRQAYEQVYALSLQKKESIIENDAQSVNEIVKREWEFVSRISDLEEQRVALVASLAAEQQLAELPTLQELYAYATQEQCRRLDENAQALKELFNQQKLVNAQMQGLIELHMEYVDYMVNMFLVEPQTSNIYGNSGIVEEGNAKNVNIIDSQA